MKRSSFAAALIGLAALLASCAAPVSPTGAYATPPVPPPPRPEVVPKPPVSAIPLLWKPGHWGWTGAGYVWHRGRYVPRDGHSNMFMPGWWQQTPSGGYQWVPAHWI